MTEPTKSRIGIDWSELDRWLYHAKTCQDDTNHHTEAIRGLAAAVDILKRLVEDLALRREGKL